MKVLPIDLVSRLITSHFIDNKELQSQCYKFRKIPIATFMYGVGYKESNQGKGFLTIERFFLSLLSPLLSLLSCECTDSLFVT